VRPRSYFELRSCDALVSEWFVAPLAFVAGLVYHQPSAREALDVLGAPDPGLLALAGRCGLADPKLASRARDLWRLAREGCLALGDAFIAGPDVEQVDEYVRRFTACGRSPAHDSLDSLTT
jgi:hypothetical protein